MPISPDQLEAIARFVCPLADRSPVESGFSPRCRASRTVGRPGVDARELPVSPLPAQLSLGVRGSLPVCAAQDGFDAARCYRSALRQGAHRNESYPSGK